MIEMEEALRIPLTMSKDCASLAPDVTLGVLFSRRGELAFEKVAQLCQDINEEGNGVIGISAYLAPNSLLLIGQGDTLDRLSDRRKEISDERVFLRRNDNKWPPLHTPLVWQHNIPNRSMQMMHVMPILADAPTPAVFSLVTGEANYTRSNLREIIGDWVDHPQRLWDAVLHTTSEGVEHIVHVGPQPNIIPATFDRLAGNVSSQTKESVSIRALSGIVNRPWLTSLLPRRASLLRATQLTHIKLEEWLVEHAPS
ncbi:MAG: ACP S-malonyltransferase, partial [Planctomycetota bacterium]